MPIPLEAFGDAAVRARLPSSFDARALLDALRAHPAVVDAVVTERHALVTFEPPRRPEGLEAVIAAVLRAPRSSRASTGHHAVAVRYDGGDLDEVARQTGLSARQVVEVHAGGDYFVAALGFLPGFAYLRGLDPRLAIPRRAVPRTRVAPLSVAIAGPYAGVYPYASPGGWHLVGTALDFAPFDPRTGARFALGDRVRFVESGP